MNPTNNLLNSINPTEYNLQNRLNNNNIGYNLPNQNVFGNHNQNMYNPPNNNNGAGNVNNLPSHSQNSFTNQNQLNHLGLQINPTNNISPSSYIPAVPARISI